MFVFEQKRKIIIDNYRKATKEVELETLSKKGLQFKTKPLLCKGVGGCGDVLYLLLKKEGVFLKECWFSGEEVCLLTKSLTNILCNKLENKEMSEVRRVLQNCRLMLEKKKYNLADYPEIEVFSDVSTVSPNRIACLEIVFKGFEEAIKK